VSKNIWNLEELDLLCSNIEKSVINIVEEFRTSGYVDRSEEIMEKLSGLEEEIEELTDEIDFLDEFPSLDGFEFVDVIDPEASLFVQEADTVRYDIPFVLTYTGTSDSKYKTNTTLVVPDCHDKPGVSKERFTKLGKLIVDKRPSRIVVMGDFSSCASLSHWDKNKRLTIEGKRYKEDVKSAREAIKEMFSPLWLLQREQSDAGKLIYAPEVVWLLGNHEDWVRQYTVYNPAMSGYLDIIEDLELEKFCDTIVPYRKYVEIEGIIFSHVPMNGGNVPVSGKHAIFRAQDQCSKSQVFAHTHRWEHISNQRHGDDDIIQTLSTGFFDFEKEEYCEDAPLGWWSGVTILTHWKPGRFDVEQISLPRLLEMY
jgi:hypothetical protein